MKINFPYNQDLLKLNEIFNKNNQDNLRIVGGAVRNFLLNKKIIDFDLSATFTPTETQKILNEYVANDGNISFEMPNDIQKVVLVASGSSYHCARFGADLFGKVANVSARAIYSSEYLLKPKAPDEEDILYIFITQSGETSDTLRAAKRAKQMNMKIACITNNNKSLNIDNIDESKIIPIKKNRID